MKLYVYTLQGCKVCTQRQNIHNQLSEYMNQLGVEQLGVLYGMINGERYEPLPEHDGLCRKPEDPSKYQAPCYILEAGDNIVKLEDAGNFSNVEDYANYIANCVEKALAAQ